MPKAGVITIDLKAGTAQFIQQMDQAGAKMREFGQHGVTGVQATSGALRVLEGNMTNNLRAAERFVAQVLGLGEALKVAFPVVGAIALGGVLDELGKKAYDFYVGIRDAGEKAQGAYRGLEEPLRLTNDELRVANDRLENDIAKLEGHHENSLKLALDEARLAADRLADSLDKDLERAHKVFEENKVPWYRRPFEAGTTDIAEDLGGKTGFGGFRQQIAEIGEKSAPGERAANLLKAYGDELAKVNTELNEAQRLSKTKFTDESTGEEFAAPSQTARIEMLTAAARSLREEMERIRLQSQNAALTGKKESDEAQRENARQDRPFEDRMQAMTVQIDQVRGKLETLGQPQATQNLVKAFGDAQKAILEVNKELERHNTQLTAAQKNQILVAEETLVGIQAETEWQAKLVGATTSIEEHIRSQQLLAQAIGKGYEATKQANVETRVMQELGEHFTDQSFLQQHAADVEKLRAEYAREYDAQHAEASAQAVQKLNEQIELERELARVQSEGAEAVRQAALAVKLRQLAVQGATKEQIQAEMDLYNAQRANSQAEGLAKINERIGAEQRLSAAVLEGAEAERKAALENKYAEMQRAGASDEEVAQQRKLDAAEHQRQVTQEALKTGMAYQDQLEKINEQIAALEKIKAERGDTLAIEISLRDLENQRIDLLVRESLAIGNAGDGVRAFFLEMQKDAKNTAQVIYDSLNSALDKTADNLAKLTSGQKTSWAKDFQQIGEQLQKQGYEDLIHQGLKQVGKMVGLDLSGVPVGKPDGTSADRAIWVRIAGGGPGIGGSGSTSQSGSAAGVPQPGDDSDQPALGGGLFGSGSKGKGIFSLLKKNLFGGGAGSGESIGTMNDQIATSDDDSDSAFGGFMAGGGDVTPGLGYWVGEREPEYFEPSTSGRITPLSAMHGQGHTFNYNIDARGADLGAHNRIARGIEASHKAAVATAVQAVHERSRRTPGGK